MSVPLLLPLGWGIGAVATAYQLLSISASLLFVRRKEIAGSPHGQPPVSVLKPIRGLDQDFYEAIRSHAVQDYAGKFEILFGVKEPTDAAVPLVQRLQSEFPDRDIRLIVAPTEAPNGKVGVLIDLAASARNAVLVVNDSDISVPVDYLRRVVAPLDREQVGLVTCLYRARAKTWAARWEALSIATDFAPSVLVAPLVGVREFAFGSTLCFRKADLHRIGGFAALAEYLADDYQLGKRITALGKKNYLSHLVVDTQVGGRTWADVWAHQVRWSRTIRVSKGGGYLGIPVTLGGFWLLVMLALSAWWWVLALLVIRLAAAYIAAGPVLGDWKMVRLVWLTPLRDCLALAVWVAGLRRGPVVWRDKVLDLKADGRIAEHRHSRSTA